MKDDTDKAPSVYTLNCGESKSSDATGFFTISGGSNSKSGMLDLAKTTGYIQFTIDKGTATVTGKFRSTSNSNTSSLALYSVTGETATKVNDSDITVTGQTDVDISYKNLAAGTYRVANTGAKPDRITSFQVNIAK